MKWRSLVASYNNNALMKLDIIFNTYEVQIQLLSLEIANNTGYFRVHFHRAATLTVRVFKIAVKFFPDALFTALLVNAAIPNYLYHV